MKDASIVWVTSQSKSIKSPQKLKRRVTRVSGPRKGWEKKGIKARQEGIHRLLRIEHPGPGLKYDTQATGMGWEVRYQTKEEVPHQIFKQ